MKYIRFLWLIAFVLFILPFLGFPQAFKDFLTIACAISIGFLAWFRSEKIKHRKKMLQSLQEQSKTE